MNHYLKIKNCPPAGEAGKLKIRSERNGFSLMELMIIVAIIGIMTGIGLVSLNSSKTTKALENASREVAAAIREAQNNALTGEQSGGGQFSCGHGFYFDASVDATRYYIYDNPYGGANNDCSGALIVYTSGTSSFSSTYNLKDSVEFSSPVSADFYFSVPHAVAHSGGGAFGSGARIIGLEKNSRTYYICIYADGNVIENGPLATCP